MDSFYRAFEERYRGSRKTIRLRLEVYLPFILPFKMFDLAPTALDLGCGRGEWLELMGQNGIQAKGVDFDEGMLSACHALSLDVYQADVLEYLKGVATSSLSVVSAFHVVEHISFGSLRQLVDEAYRVLHPGGVLILETPNSENLVVGTSSFYLDPTHTRPIPAQLLSFVVEYAGFKRVNTLYLQESEKQLMSDRTKLFSIFFDGVSPDYSIVAQKKAPAAIYSKFNEPFNRAYGMRLNTLAARYDVETEGVVAGIVSLEAKANQAEAKANQAEAKANEIELELKIKTTQLEALLFAISKSSSWKITEPLRMVGRVTKKVLSLIKVSNLKHQKNHNLLFAHIKLYINRRKRLRRIVLGLLTSFPVMDAYIKQKTRNYQLVDVELTSLSPSARPIYADLKKAIEARKN